MSEEQVRHALRAARSLDDAELESAIVRRVPALSALKHSIEHQVQRPKPTHRFQKRLSALGILDTSEPVLNDDAYLEQFDCALTYNFSLKFSLLKLSSTALSQ